MTFQLTQDEALELSRFAISKAQTIITNIRNFMKSTGAKGIVMGVSGGIDSALTLKLCVEAIGAENVLGIMMPYSDALHSENTKDAIDLCISLGVRFVTIDIGDMVDTVAEGVRWDKPVERETSYKVEPETFDRVLMGNIMARTRMTVTYHHALANNYLVAGTSNKTELMTGYFTKWGDGACDFEVIGDLLKIEVREISKELGIPQKIIDKAPSANLYEGQTDEDQLGFSYDELDYMLYYIGQYGDSIYEMDKFVVGDTQKYYKAIIDRVGTEKFIKLRRIIRMTEHKRSLIPIMGNPYQ